MLDSHRNIDHTPFKKKPTEKDEREHGHESLADQIREKILMISSQNTKPDVDMISRAFNGAAIRLKEVRHLGYNGHNVRGFFSALDFVDTVYVAVQDKNRPYVDNDSLLIVRLGSQEHTLPVPLFRLCLPQDMKQKFKSFRSFYRVYQNLFSAYGRKLLPISSM